MDGELIICFCFTASKQVEQVKLTSCLTNSHQIHREQYYAEEAASYERTELTRNSKVKRYYVCKTSAMNT